MKEIDKLKLRIAALDIAQELSQFFRTEINIVLIDDLRESFIEEVIETVERCVKNSGLICMEEENV